MMYNCCGVFVMCFIYVNVAEYTIVFVKLFINSLVFVFLAHVVV